VVALILLTLLVPNIQDFAAGQYGLTNVSQDLVDILTFGQPVGVGSLILVVVMSILGLSSGLVHVLPEKIEAPLVTALVWTLGISLLSEVVQGVLRPLLGSAQRAIFVGNALRPVAAAVIFVLIAAISAWWRQRGRAEIRARVDAGSAAQRAQLRTATYVLLGILLLVLPLLLGRRLTDVLDTVGVFILMGLGLNIVVGFAGLLDLGYVAFFAIGAYTVGILTSQGDLGIASFTFWQALPFAVAAAILAGIILGTPVLRMRGDYLAIVTLGFGEIIGILALSDVLKPYIGGAQGILQIPKPTLFGFTILRPEHFYYLILVGCLLAAFVAWRLRDARLGRQWMALREDEDVAEAMGIHLVTTKLLAFAIGAAFSGLAGAIFASRLGSIYPNSFNLLISINVLSLIIVGGIGSLPGVVVGALVLVGLPELLREFESYRLLLYGAVLIVTMLARPEGLWPSPIRQRELKEVEETFASEEGENPFTDESMAEQVVERPSTAID
jgi:branched-chain amino acid transport system permease protein